MQDINALAMSSNAIYKIIVGNNLLCECCIFLIEVRLDVFKLASILQSAAVKIPSLLTAIGPGNLDLLNIHLSTFIKRAYLKNLSKICLKWVLWLSSSRLPTKMST